ncbi:exonuclease domain-containing protein [Corynebacterium timonense]|uniref:DNA polymerase-3 subunit epsilon n=1 Tax=Corynebacterium timonense TaxID=441500 RepID=A0A1H1TR78_9CORY|nr:exonuclease domain-containing protein [Corynebacterium timonense]SDS62089.1 DNA polymerase-3 subunit epsilon [Corynebacterium timonense]
MSAARTDPDDYPYVAVFVQATGIHPTTSRLISIDAVAFDDSGRVGEDLHIVVNPGEDPGPRHMHGLEPGDVGQAPRFSRHLKTLDKLLDARTLVTHDSPFTWGFIVSEARRAMNAAARANRSRNRRNGRRRQRVGHVPRPTAIVDTLASARRCGIIPEDTRIGAVARLVGVDGPDPTASVERAQRPEEETSRELTLTVVATFLELRSRGTLSSYAPEDLTADRFSLQRSTRRVDAAAEKAEAENPGVYSAGRGVRAGMEVVVADDVRVEPDEIISAALEAGLVYAEKLSRQTSLVVSDAVAAGAELRGKAMHGHRKGIPVLSAEEFFAAVSAPGRASAAGGSNV